MVGTQFNRVRKTTAFLSRHFLFIAVPTVPPLDVHFTKRSERKLVVSWNKPDAGIWSGIATRYKICHSTQERALQPTCKETDRLSYEIASLQPSTKYFVTVSAGTSVGFGPKSVEIIEITDGGMNPVWVRALISFHWRKSKSVRHLIESEKQL